MDGLGQEQAAYRTVKVRRDGEVCYLQMHRPQAGNAINDTLLAECRTVLDACSSWAKVLVLEGLPEVFCSGADLHDVAHTAPGRGVAERNAQALYDLWLQFKRGPFISIAHVRGKVSAGGVGFAAACDLVLCEESAAFSLPELLFGLMPACVLPFLAARVGAARAHRMALTTQPVNAAQALSWGLVDFCGESSANLLRAHLLRLRLISRHAIVRYKRYSASLDGTLEAAREAAVTGNAAVFTDPHTLAGIQHYAATGAYPWEVAVPSTREE